jgi:hypothetical protein
MYTDPSGHCPVCIFLLVAAVALTACAPSSPTPAYTPAPTNTPTPSSTPQPPSATPVPSTNTPRPTYTSTSTATSTPGLIGPLAVPYYPQPTGTSCGPTAFTMAWNYLHNDRAMQLQDVIDTAIASGWYLPDDPTKVYTSPANLFNLASHYASANNLPAPTAGNVDINDPAAAQAFLRASSALAIRSSLTWCMALHQERIHTKLTSWL